MECSHVGLLLVVRELIIHVVYSHSTLLALKSSIGLLRDALVRPVAGPEVERGGPVVGEIVGGLACCAIGQCGVIVFDWGHGSVE